MINEEISPLLKGRDVLGLKKIDDTLLAFQKKKGEQEIQISDLILRACSEALLYAFGQSTSPAAPYKALYKYLKNRELEWGPGAVLPKMVFNVLNGGKAVASKVKFSKFYLIIDVTPDDELDPMEVYLKIQAQLRKQIQAHKLGENGFKPGVDGAYFNAFENVNESFKFLEDAIAAVNVNVRNPRSIDVRRTKGSA